MNTHVSHFPEQFKKLMKQSLHGQRKWYSKFKFHVKYPLGTASEFLLHLENGIPDCHGDLFLALFTRNVMV